MESIRVGTESPLVGNSQEGHCAGVYWTETHEEPVD